MPVFYPGQTDYIDKLNTLATTNELVDIQAGLDTVATAVAEVEADRIAAEAAQATASSAATTATTQATTATTQAGIATTKAADAESFMSAAATWADESEFWAGQSHADQLQANWNETNGASVTYIQGKPTLGTAASLNVPASGDATTAEVVKGTDTRLTNARAINLVGSSIGDVPMWSGSAWVVQPIVQGLANFSESLSTTGVNTARNAARLLVTAGNTNVDFVASPKGTGALLTQTPDGTSSAGNKRGNNAVDLQKVRVGATQVASADTTVICGGTSNTASGERSVVCGGDSNICQAAMSVISGGVGNSISDSVVSLSVIAGGNSNACNSNFAIIPGGRTASTRGVHGMYAWGGALDKGLGKHQLGNYLLSIDTTGQTATKLDTIGSGASPTSAFANITLPNNSSYRIDFTIVARNTTTGATSTGVGKCLITRGSNASTTAIIGTPTFTWDFSTSGFTLPALSLTANTSVGFLDITVTGLASTNIRWVCLVETLEVTN